MRGILKPPFAGSTPKALASESPRAFNRECWLRHTSGFESGQPQSRLNYSLEGFPGGSCSANRASIFPDNSGYNFRMQSRQRLWLNSASECCFR
jgi:hypothetical protein